MALSGGERLGSYEVLALLGAGGMGEVYRARDTRLGRDVAIKVLPREVIDDPERVARFEREARILASLNHPNIAQIYGLEADGDTRFLVMELAEGEDLAERLSRSSLDVDEAVAVAAHIAAGLDAAHRRGVVHRDLKPANVKITPAGQVKILDFGLARAYAGQDVHDSDPSASPTITQRGAAAGTILGTAAYMSPEQARGQSVDRRSDLWSFGALLYEMLTGRRLIRATTISDALAGVLRQKIDLDALPPSTPPRVRRLLRHCLERDLDRRWQDAGDARIELLDEDAPEAVGLPPGRRLAPWWIASLIAVGTLATLGAWTAFSTDHTSAEEVSRVYRVEGPFFTDPVGVALRDDGGQVVFSTGLRQDESLRVMDFDGSAPRRLPGSEGAHSPFYAPDGTSIGFFTNQGLFRMRIGGGGARRLSRRTADIAAAAWSESGHVYFSLANFDQAQSAGIMRLPADGGNEEILTRPDREAGELAHLLTGVLPDEQGVLVTVVAAPAHRTHAIELLDPATGERHRLRDHAAFAQWAPPRHLVFYDTERNALVAQRVSIDDKRLEGKTVELVTDIETGEPDEFGFAVSNAGTMVYGPTNVFVLMQERRRVVLVRPDGSSRPLPVQRGPWLDPDITPDGRTLLLRWTSLEGCDLWRFDVDKGAGLQVAFEGDHHDPHWTPGGRIAYVHRSGHARRLEILDEVPGPPRIVYDDTSATLQLEDCTPDGSRALVSLGESVSSDRGLYLIPLDDPKGAAPAAWWDTPSRESAAAISPDGNWVAHVSHATGRKEVYVRRLEDPETGAQVSSDGGHSPFWSQDGSRLYFVQEDRLVVRRLLSDETLELSAPETYLAGPYLFEFTRFAALEDGVVALESDPDTSRSEQVYLMTNLGARLP